MPDLIRDTSQVNLPWLRRALGAPDLCSFQVDAFQSVNSRSARIRVCYADGAQGHRPEALFLKMCDGRGFDGMSEVNYYTRDYAGLVDAPIPTSYHAAYAPESGAYHILMQDLTETHRNNHDVRPTLAYGLALARALAKLHAWRWGADGLRGVGIAVPDQTMLRRYLDHVLPGFRFLLDELPSDLRRAWEPSLTDAFEHHPHLLARRAEDTNGFTLVHGDPNPGNVLSPIGGVGRLYLVDRQPFHWSLTAWLGVSDLAYAIVHWWDTTERRECEIPVLREYHSSLLREGVRGYTWEQLWEDYRLCAVQSLYVASEWCLLESDRKNLRWVWFPQLEKSLAAFTDLHCAQLWKA